jgi:cell wall-associated NlpC family hydrolase
MFFDDYEIAEKTLQLAEEWDKVKYFHRGYSKGGVDCSGYIICLFKELGLIKNIIHTEHSKDWFLHTNEELLLEELDKYKLDYLEFRDLNKLEFGDLLLFTNSKKECIHHIGLYLGLNNFTHCITDLGVTTSQLQPFWVKFLVKIIKVL